MRGIIEKLHGTFGFIRGSDGIGYFFIPSCLQITQLKSFEDLRVGLKVEFTPIDTHPKGPRALEVLIDDGPVVDLPDSEVR
jgi:cold shock CspA family protein